MSNWWKNMDKPKDDKMSYNQACWILDRHEDSMIDPLPSNDMIYRARLTKGLYESEIKDPKD